MFMTDFWKALARAPEDETGGGNPGAGGNDTAAGAGGDDTAAGGGGDDTAAGGGGDDTAAGAGGDDAAKWWEDKRFDDGTQAQLKALGLTVDDPLDAVSRLAGMEKAAKSKLGRGPDQLLEKPGEGKDVAEWMRENGDLFGIPEAPDKYEIKPPEGWPEDAPWDKAFEDEARKIAHQAGVSGPALQQLTDLYAGKVGQLMAGAASELEESNTKMQTELQADWGDQYGAKVAQAQQAAAVLGEKAGLDDDGLANLAEVLKPKIGDAGVIRLFAAVGELAGEDMAVGLKGGGSMGTTPAEARQQIEAMKAEGSEFMKEAEKARKGGNRARYDELHKEYQRLQKIAAR